MPLVMHLNVEAIPRWRLNIDLYLIRWRCFLVLMRGIGQSQA